MKKIFVLLLPLTMAGCTLSSDLRLAVSNQNATTEYYTTEFVPVGNKVPVACAKVNNVPVETQVLIGFQYTGVLKEAHMSLVGNSTDKYNSGDITFVKDSDDLGFENNYYAGVFSLNEIKPYPTKYATKRAQKEVVIGDSAKIGTFSGLVYAKSDKDARTPDAKTNQIDVYANCTLK